jgi:hypothetical protein
LGDAGELGILEALDVFGIGLGEILKLFCRKGAHDGNFRRFTRNSQVLNLAIICEKRESAP